MWRIIVLFLLLYPLSMWGQSPYTAAVRFGKGSPTYSPDTAKRESTLYFDLTNRRLFNFAYGAGWEAKTIEYTNGTPSNGIDFRVKFAIDTSLTPPKVFTRKNTTWYELQGGTSGSITFSYVEIVGTSQIIDFGVTLPATAEIYMNGQLLRPPQYTVISPTQRQINVSTVKYDLFTAKY